jgi:hypothetical protein
MTGENGKTGEKTPDGVWHGCRPDSNGEPRMWLMGLGTIGICLTKTHTNHPGKWVARCKPFFENEVLGDIEPDLAKAGALGILKADLNMTLEAVNKAIGCAR